jgi:hypothetical protein
VFFLKATVGQSPPATNILIKEEALENLQSSSKEGGNGTPNQQLGRGEVNRKDYTSEKENKNREERSWRASGQNQEESAILESLKPS